jgi:endonuclease/exonuclease/phosphatase (EEP) superfamily protein YafD
LILVTRAEDTRIEEASAWIKKYLRIASELRGDLLLRHSAKRASMLISRPIHAVNQEEADIVMKDPINSIQKKRIFQGKNNIERRIIP